MIIDYVERVMEPSNAWTLPNSADTDLHIIYQAPRRKGGTNYFIESSLDRWNDLSSFTAYIKILLWDYFYYILFHYKSFMGFHMVCERSFCKQINQ